MKAELLKSDLDISVNSANDAAAWMQNRLDGSIHPALNTDDANIIYDNSTHAFALFEDKNDLDLYPELPSGEFTGVADLFVRRAIYKEAESRRLAFTATVERYNADVKRHDVDKLDIRAKHSWESVLVMQQELHEQHRQAETSKGFKGFVQKKMRTFGENSETFQAWLKLLPTESQYLSVLCGGMKLLLGAAHRIAEIRESIRTILDEIPGTVSKAKQYIQLFEDIPELHKCNADLYVAIIDALDAVLQHCQHHLARRLSSALFKQSMSGKELQDKMKGIETFTNRLVTQAQISSMHRQKKMLEGTKDMTKMITSSVRRQDRGFNTVVLSQNDILRALESQDRKIKSIAKQQSWVLNQCMELLKANPKSMLESGPIIHYQGSGIASKGHGNAPNQKSSAVRAVQETKSNKERFDDLLRQLNVDEQVDVVADDLSIQSTLIHTMSLASQDRAVALMISPWLQSWLVNPSSSLLHINGNMFSNEHEACQSPLSYVCAKFVHSIQAKYQQPQGRDSGPVFTVCWFCGQHTDMRSDYDAHPTGMLNNLLSQLIHQLSSSVLQSEPMSVSLPAGDPQLSDLCNVFVQLVTALPIGTIIFCVIDGISYYEDSGRQAECIEVLSMLTTLTRHCQGVMNGPLIKLLVTAPLRSRHAHDFFEAEEIFDMDERYPAQGGFSALQWDLGVGGVISQ